MQWEFIAVLILAVPIVLLPVAYIWYLNVGGIYGAVRGALDRRAARKKRRGLGDGKGGPAFRVDLKDRTEIDDRRDRDS